MELYEYLHRIERPRKDIAEIIINQITCSYNITKENLLKGRANKSIKEARKSTAYLLTKIAELTQEELNSVFFKLRKPPQFREVNFELDEDVLFKYRMEYLSEKVKKRLL